MDDYIPLGLADPLNAFRSFNSQLTQEQIGRIPEKYIVAIRREIDLTRDIGKRFKILAEYMASVGERAKINEADLQIMSRFALQKRAKEPNSLELTTTG